MRAIPPNQVVFVDETGMDDNDAWRYGWSARGQRCFALVSGKRTTRVSLIAGERGGELIAPFMFEGYCNAAVFEAYVEYILLPELKPGQIVVIDNARFHQSLITRQLIENAGCILKFLPPYSPDLSPIEHRWCPIKQATRKILRNFTDILAALHTVLISSPIKC
jgi:transposase